MAVPTGTVGNEDRRAITAGHDDDVSSSIAVGRPRNNDRGPAIGGSKYLLERPAITPGGFETELLHRRSNASFGGQP